MGFGLKKQQSAAVRPDGTPLCIDCGLCCNGVLYGHVDVPNDEVDELVALGFAIHRDTERPTFQQPCPMLRGTLCSVYADRPSTCRKYRCALLTRYQNEELSLEESISIVAKAKELVREVNEGLPANATLRTLRNERSANFAGIESVAENDRAQFTRRHLRLAMLERFLDRYFRKESDKVFVDTMAADEPPYDGPLPTS